MLFCSRQGRWRRRRKTWQKLKISYKLTCGSHRIQTANQDSCDKLMIFSSDPTGFVVITLMPCQKELIVNIEARLHLGRSASFQCIFDFYLADGNIHAMSDKLNSQSTAVLYCPYLVSYYIWRSRRLLISAIPRPLNYWAHTTTECWYVSGLHFSFQQPQMVKTRSL